MLFLWVFALCMFFFFGFRRVLLRRVALVTGVVSGLLFVLSVTLYSTRLEQLQAHRFAIIMPDETVVRSTPDASGVESFIIHEGLKIEILESREQYYHIRLADGKSGWIQRSSAERI
jgi:SH3-like domain-containing protein